MFTSIKTSRENKEVVRQLTQKLQLGAENVIARMAFAYSLSKERQLDLAEISDSQGKEYSKKVLFGNYSEYYVAMLCVHYNLYKTDKDISRYIKMHIDDGLNLIQNEFEASGSSRGMEFIIREIDKGLGKFGS